MLQQLRERLAKLSAERDDLFEKLKTEVSRRVKTQKELALCHRELHQTDAATPDSATVTGSPQSP